MLRIDENELKLLLEKRKDNLGRWKYDGIGEIVSSISLFITLVLSDYEHITFIEPLHFKIIVEIISAIIGIYGIYTVIKSMEKYSVEQLYNEIADIDPDIYHSFDIVVIRNWNDNGKYLVFKNIRWRCWLFPNYHCLNKEFLENEELKYVTHCIKRDLNVLETDFKYIGSEISEKYSVGDRITKKYTFHYYETMDIVHKFDNVKRFYCNGKKYRWMTLQQMYNNKNIVKKNKDVLDYIRSKCDIA